MKTVSALLVLILAAVIVFFVYWGRVPDTLAKTLSQKLGVKVTIAKHGYYTCFGERKTDRDRQPTQVDST